MRDPLKTMSKMDLLTLSLRWSSQYLWPILLPMLMFLPWPTLSPPAWSITTLTLSPLATSSTLAPFPIDGPWPCPMLPFPRLRKQIRMIVSMLELMTNPKANKEICLFFNTKFLLIFGFVVGSASGQGFFQFLFAVFGHQIGFGDFTDKG